MPAVMHSQQHLPTPHASTPSSHFPLPCPPPPSPFTAPSQIILIGHSAGAHLCMMALMHRAHAAHSAGGTAAGGAAASGGAQPGMPGAAGLLEAAHCVMPQQFLAIAGVYDISKHYVSICGQRQIVCTNLRMAHGL